MIRIDRSDSYFSRKPESWDSLFALYGKGDASWGRPTASSRPGPRSFKGLAFQGPERMSGYLLDTNIASHATHRDKPRLGRRLASLPIEEIAISAVTEGDLLFGLARRN